MYQQASDIPLFTFRCDSSPFLLHNTTDELHDEIFKNAQWAGVFEGNVAKIFLFQLLSFHWLFRTEDSEKQIDLFGKCINKDDFSFLMMRRQRQALVYRICLLLQLSYKSGDLTDWFKNHMFQMLPKVSKSLGAQKVFRCDCAALTGVYNRQVFCGLCNSIVRIQADDFNFLQKTPVVIT